jgi:hypothetical protein
VGESPITGRAVAHELLRVVHVIVLSLDRHAIAATLWTVPVVLHDVEELVVAGKSVRRLFNGNAQQQTIRMLLVCGSLAGADTANAAMLQLTGGIWQTTPAQVINDLSAGNDVLTTPVKFWDNAIVTTNQPVQLTFYYVGAESGFTNTLNVTGGGTHADDNSFPGGWSNPALFSITLGANQSVPLSFTSSGPGFPLAPGGGNSLGAGNFDRSIGFAVLSCTTGAPACFSTDQSLLTGNVFAFLLDDGGANVDDNHDDYVGYMVATTPVPLPAAAWLLLSGVGLLGAAGRRRKS